MVVVVVLALTHPHYNQVRRHGTGFIQPLWSGIIPQGKNKKKQNKNCTHLQYITAEASRTSAKEYKNEIGSQRTYVPAPYWYVRFKPRS